MSSVFWCLFGDDILKLVLIVGFKNGWDALRDIMERESGGGGTGRVRSLVLSHHIDVRKVKVRQSRPHRSARTPNPLRHKWFIAKAIFLECGRRFSIYSSQPD